MIEAEAIRNDQIIMARRFDSPHLSLENVLLSLEMYVKEEQLNTAGEVLLRVRFGKG